MTDSSQRDINAIREFLLSAFNGDEMDDLLTFAEGATLQEARNAYVPSDSLRAKVRRRPEQYAELRGELRGAAAVVLALPADLADCTGREADIERVRTQIE